MTKYFQILFSARKWVLLGLDIYLAYLNTVYVISGLVLVAKYIKEPTSFWNIVISSLLAISLDLSNYIPSSTGVVIGVKLCLLNLVNKFCVYLF